MLETQISLINLVQAWLAEHPTLDWEVLNVPKDHGTFIHYKSGPETDGDTRDLKCPHILIASDRVESCCERPHQRSKDGQFISAADPEFFSKLLAMIRAKEIYAHSL